MKDKGLLVENKYDLFKTFKNWKALVENETWKKLKILKSNNGREYYRKDFDNYCEHDGIIRIKVVPRIPQNNEVPKRMNRIILECERCIRLHAS